MNKRNLIALLLCAALMQSLTGCGEGGSASSSSPEAESSASPEPETSVSEVEEKIPFTLGYYSEAGLNPYTSNNTQNQTLMGLIYEPLFELDQSFAVQPCLAEKVSCSMKNKTTATTQTTAGSSSADSSAQEEKATSYTVATITLRNDVRFHNGDRMDADDVVYSLERAKASGSIYRSRLSCIDSVRRTGDKVELTLNRINNNVASLLDVPIVQYGTADRDIPMGTGPYQVKTDDNGAASMLRAYSKWWKNESLSLSSIPLYAAEDSDTLIFGFSSGSVTLVTTDLTGTDALSYTGNYDVKDYDTTNMIYLGCNAKTGACKEEKLRSAIYRSIDRETIVSKLLSGHASASALPVSPSSRLYNSDAANSVAYDIQAAEKAIADSGASSSSLKLIVNSDSSFKVTIAKEIASGLEEYGLNVSVDTLSWSDYTAALKSGDFDLYLGEVRLTGDFNIATLVNRKGSLNYGEYYDKTTTKLLSDFMSKTGDERVDAAALLYKDLTEKAPFIPICFKEYSVLYSWGSVEEMSPTQGNLFYSFPEWKLTTEE